MDSGNKIMIVFIMILLAILVFSKIMSDKSQRPSDLKKVGYVCCYCGGRGCA